MRVRQKMIAKDLRPMGWIYKALMYNLVPGIPLSKINFGVSNSRKRRTHNEYLTRPDGTKLRVIVRKPTGNRAAEASGKPSPAVLWVHGGGYSTGMPEMIFMSMAQVVNETCTVVAPAYCLSGEKPYPAALDDCYQTLCWMAEHAEELGIDPDGIFVGGESAGGGMTAALCLYARDKGFPKICGQMPLYPMLDCRMETESMKQNNAPVWNCRQNEKAWRRYLGGLSPENCPPYASPSLETDLSGLPPAISFVGSIEPFRDETIAYMDRLKEAGTDVQFRIFEGAYHAFDMMAPWTPTARQARAFFSEAFRTLCADTLPQNR